MGQTSTRALEYWPRIWQLGPNTRGWPAPNTCTTGDPSTALRATWGSEAIWWLSNHSYLNQETVAGIKLASHQVRTSRLGTALSLPPLVFFLLFIIIVDILSRLPARLVKQMTESRQRCPGGMSSMLRCSLRKASIYKIIRTREGQLCQNH